MDTTGDETNNQEHEAPANDQEATEVAIAAALAALDAPLPESVQPEPPGEHPQGEPQPSLASPTLAALDESRRPKDRTVCESCPNSVWFSSPAEVKCYCRVMFLIVWSDREPNEITACDGIFLGREE